MSENSRPRWFLPVIFAALVLITGCATVGGTAPTAVGTTPNEDTKARIEQWKCGDYFRRLRIPRNELRNVDSQPARRHR